jgi:hypothetical protein
MLSGFGSMIGLRAKKAAGGGGGGGDYTPNAVNWANLLYNGFSGEFPYSERQITGIDQTITLEAAISDNLTDVWVLVGTSASFGGGDGTSVQDPSFLGFTQLYNGDTFTVTNNKYVCFMGSGSCTSVTVTVKNQSDGNATLDTFDYDGINC